MEGREINGERGFTDFIDLGFDGSDNSVTVDDDCECVSAHNASILIDGEKHFVLASICVVNVY